MLTPELLESLLSAARVGIAVYDRDLRYISFNKALAELAGVTPAERIGLTIWEAVPYLAPALEPILRGVLESGRPTLNVEGLSVTPTRKHWLASYFPIQENGETTGVGAVILDVTHQKLVQESLKESEERFRVLADTAPVLIWMCGTDGYCTFFNKQWLKFTGRTMEQELGNGWTESVHPDDHERCVDMFRSALARREEFRMEYRLRRENGEYRWMLNTGIPRFLSNGQFAGYIGSCIDITERVQVEETLRLLAEASGILASSLDYETTLSNVVQLIVPSFADACIIDLIDGEASHAVAGAYVDPVTGKPIYQTPPAEDFPYRLHNRFDFSATMGSPSNAGAPGGPRTSSVVAPASHLIVPLASRGRTIGSITFVAYTIERRYSESRLAVAEELARRAALAVDNARLYQQVQQALRLRDGFLAAAVHELRTPATVLLGYIDILQRRPPTDEREQRAFQAIRLAAQRATRLALELSESADLVQGTLRLIRVPVDLAELGEEAIAIVQPDAPQHRLTLRALEHPVCPVDMPRIKLVVRGLLEHAIRYQPQGGVIELVVDRDGHYAIVEVRDCGAGIPPDRLAHVFEPMFEPWPAGSPHYIGIVGLHLYLARGLVEAHGGTVTVNSRVGEGTTVRLNLPIEAIPPAAGR